MKQTEQLIWAVEVDLIKDFQRCHLSLLPRYGRLTRIKLQYIHWSATTSTNQVHKTGYLVTMRRYSGETWRILVHLTTTIHPNSVTDKVHPLIASSLPNISLWHTTKTAQERLEEHDKGLWCRPRLQIPPHPNSIKDLRDLLDWVWSMVAPVHNTQDLPPVSWCPTS